MPLTYYDMLEITCYYNKHYITVRPVSDNSGHLLYNFAVIKPRFNRYSINNKIA